MHIKKPKLRLHKRRIINGSANYLFFGKCKKKLLNICSNSFYYLKLQSFRLIMENNFIEMAVSADHAVAYMIGPIFKHIIDCVQWLHEYCPLKRRNTYLWWHPTNNIPTVSNHSSEMACRLARHFFNWKCSGKLLYAHWTYLWQCCI